MKNSLLLVGPALAGLLLAGAGRAQAQVPIWQLPVAVAASAAGSGTNSMVTATVADANGNVYVAGFFQGTMVVGGTTLTSAGGNDIFVAKYNPTTSSYVWVKQLGGPGTDDVQALALSGSSLYVGGHFASSALAVGSAVLANASPAGSPDIFVAKLSDAGSSATWAWAQRAGGAGSDHLWRLAAAGPSVYFTGYTSSAPATFGATTLANAGGADCYVAKLVDAGSTATWAWALGAGGPGNDEGYGLAVSSGNVYVGGAFASASLPVGSTTLVGMGNYDGFVAKIVDAGGSAAFAWAQRLGGAGSDGINGVVVNGPSVYVAGSFASTNLTAGPITLATTGGSDVLLAKLVDQGSSAVYGWAQRAGSAYDDCAQVLVGQGSALYLAGYFAGGSPGAGTRATFGPHVLTGAGGLDVLVARATDAGPTVSFDWARQGGGSADEQAVALAPTFFQLMVGGSFAGPSTTFGLISLAGAAPVANAFLVPLREAPLATLAATPEALGLYPNPAHGTATVAVPAGVGAASISLLDGLGRVLRSAPAPAGQPYALPLGGLAPGLYAVRVRVGEEALTRRLVVE